MTYLGIYWKVLEATGRHLPDREVGTATITLTSLKLKASYDMKWKLPQMHTAKVLNAWPSHTLLSGSQFSFNTITGIPVRGPVKSRIDWALLIKSHILIE